MNSAGVQCSAALPPTRCLRPRVASLASAYPECVHGARHSHHQSSTVVAAHGRSRRSSVASGRSAGCSASLSQRRSLRHEWARRLHRSHARWTRHANAAGQTVDEAAAAGGAAAVGCCRAARRTRSPCARTGAGTDTGSSAGAGALALWPRTAALHRGGHGTDGRRRCGRSRLLAAAAAAASAGAALRPPDAALLRAARTVAIRSSCSSFGRARDSRPHVLPAAAAIGTLRPAAVRLPAAPAAAADAHGRRILTAHGNTAAATLFPATATGVHVRHVLTRTSVVSAAAATTAAAAVRRSGSGCGPGSGL